MPMATRYTVSPVPTKASTTLAASISAPSPHQAELVCSRAALQAHTEVGLKLQLSPRGQAAKEEKLKSLLATA